MDLTLNRRFSQGLTGQFAYTFSKKIDNLPSGGQLGKVGGIRDPYNGRLDRGLGVIHRPHLVRAAFVYDLPFGKGGSAVVRALASNPSFTGPVRINGEYGEGNALGTGAARYLTRGLL